MIIQYKLSQKNREAADRATISVFDSLFEDSRKRQSDRRNSENFNKTIADKNKTDEFTNVCLQD